MDPYQVRLADVEHHIKESLELKKQRAKPLLELAEDPHSGRPILVKDGRYGPYVSDGKTNASLPKDMDPKKVSFDEAVELLAKKRKGGDKRRFVKK